MGAGTSTPKSDHKRMSLSLPPVTPGEFALTPKVKRAHFKNLIDKPVRSASANFSSRAARAATWGENSPLSNCSGEASPYREQRLPDVKDRRSKFLTVNDFVFQHVEQKTNPLNYGSPSMTRDTFEFLDHFKDSPIATILRDLFFSQSYTIEGKDMKEVEGHAKDYARILEYCLDNMLSSMQVTDRIIWQTRLFNLIQQVYQSEFGDIAMKYIKERTQILLGRFPVIGDDGSDSKSQAGLGDLGIVVTQGAKLSNFLKTLKEPKYVKKTKKDEEFEAMNGPIAIPSELSALDEILKHIEKIHGKFREDMRALLEKEGGDHFKCNVKGHDRAAYKMNEYAAKKPRPSFDHLFDMIRCRAVYSDISQVKKVVQAISKKYKVVAFKDKINTALKNVTMNIVYQDAIAEIQLACGEVTTEYHSHKLYEIFRCQNMMEIFDVVLGWGDYSFDDFKPCNFWILPVKNVEPKSLFSVQENTAHPVLKSLEYGVVNDEVEFIQCEDNPRSACWQNMQHLVCQFDDTRIQSVSLHGSQIIGDYQIEHHILPRDDLVQNITGTYSSEGIKSLEFITKQGKKIALGKTKGDKTFDMKIPKHMLVLGFYFTWNGSGVQSIACWFGEIPILSQTPAIENPKDALPELGLVSRCEECCYQLYWEWNDEKDRACYLCNVKIDKNAGYADCVRSSNPICSSCYGKMPRAKELTNVLKLKCPKGTLYKWKFKTKEGFKCSDCKTSYNENTGFFMNEDGSSKICSGCYKKKGTVQERVYYSTFPVVQIDKPCGECNKDLVWYWNAKLLGRANDEFECNECQESYPVTAGCYNCKGCDYFVCSTCYNNNEDNAASKMPNFLRKKCPFTHFLTWQFSAQGPWMCNKCEVSYPKNAGCYTCPDQDCHSYKECAACYLQTYLNFQYDNFNLQPVTQEQIDLVLRNGRFKADIQCQLCTGACNWVWNAKTIPGYQNKSGFICNIHKAEVPHNLGTFHCFKCNFDVCSQCYYVDMKKPLPSIPSDRKKCPKGNRLQWKTNHSAAWDCSNCGVASPGKQTGYACTTAKCGCNNEFKLCPGCYIANDQKIAACHDCDECKEPYHWVWNLQNINKDYCNGFTCVSCDRQTHKNEGGFKCEAQCLNDICASCMDSKNEKKPIAMPNKSKCPGNSTMTWNSKSEFTWYCFWCSSKMPPEAGGFSCNKDKCKCKSSQICSHCYEQYHL